MKLYHGAVMELDALRVLVVDCQTSGATPAHGDLLELGWAVTDARASLLPARAASADPTARGDPTAPRPPSRRARIAAFDASRYDRLRVLATELRRVAKEGGAAEVRVGRHVVPL
ncbi:MAG: hypothetical protein KIT84_19375 [Labilithrix sp.]|nr:hypothetical protein [Labilithrix sp.]MCW5813197.1 hypothetical protein [Labilithrix sp.]